MYSIATAIQVAFYWKYKKSLNYEVASDVANDILFSRPPPDYVREWLDHIRPQRKEHAPTVQFLLTVVK